MAAFDQETATHETVMDVTGEQLARVYAEAFLGAAEAAGNSASAVDELEAFATQMITPFPKFAMALESAFLSHEERSGMLDRVAGGRVTPVVLNTLKVLSQHNRMSLIRSVAKQARELFNLSSGRVPVEVTSAEKLSDQLVSELADALRAKLSIEPVIESKTDPEMIAGLRVRVGDTVYDSSLQTALTRTRRVMVSQALQRIENAPEQFMNVAAEDN